MTADAQRGPEASGLVDLRTSPGATEIARDVVRVSGPHAVEYLQGQLSHDVADLAVGASAPSFVLQPAGKVDAWLRVTRVADDEMVLDVDGGYGEALLARLRRFLLRTKADVDPLAWRALALRGPGAEAAAPEAVAELRLPAYWPGVEAVDLLGTAPRAPAGMAPASADAYAALRIRCGVPAMGAELTEATIPAEVGQWVVDASVSFTKGCFTGQELVARIDSRGGNVPRRLRGLDIRTAPGDGGRAPAAVPAGVEPGAPVVAGDGEVGRVTSVAPSAGGGAVGLAIVGRGAAPPASVEIVAGDRRVPAVLVDLPFES
ncbi:MAG TPA: glycine cleavage T C-terminal barrel domain-containing protein [Acidimicrobiales bacterium]